MKKAIPLLLLTAFASLSVPNAQAGSAVVVSSNGYYGAAWSAFLNAEKAIAKATALCQRKGGVNIKVLVCRNEDPATGMIFGPSLPRVTDRVRLLEQDTERYQRLRTEQLLLIADKKQVQVLTL